MYYCFYCHLFLEERGTPHPHTPSSRSLSFFFLKENLGHMPQRNAKCFNSFAPFLSGCHLQGFSLCPEVICSGWTIKAIMVASCFPIMSRDDWQQRDGAGVEGHPASIYLIWRHSFFFHWFPLLWQNTNKLVRLSPWVVFFVTKIILSDAVYQGFQFPFSPSRAKRLLATVGDAGQRMPAV